MSNDNLQQKCEALQHSLTQALNECDELRHENAHQKELLEELGIAVNSDNKAETIRLLQIQIKNWQAVSEGQNEAIADLQSDLDTAKNDLTVADAAIEELEKEKDGLWNTIEKPEIGYTHVWDLLKRAEKKVEEFSNGVLERDRTISNLQIQIDGRDAALRGSVKTVKELNQQIQILQENLTRSNSDRLSELTSIMRMVQAIDKTPQANLVGALYLIKRVIYTAICKLDPSQSVEL